MLNFPKFQCTNFSPREGVSAQVNNLLTAIADHAPSDSTCEARIERIDSRFYFEIVIYSAVGKFHSRKNYYTHSSIVSARDWHVPVIAEMCQELRMSLNEWNKQRAAA